MIDRCVVQSQLNHTGDEEEPLTSQEVIVAEVPSRLK